MTTESNAPQLSTQDIPTFTLKSESDPETDAGETADAGTTPALTGAGFPYTTVQQCQNMFGRMTESGVPHAFDGSFFSTASGSVAGQNRQMLKFYDLMDEERHPTDLLRQLVAMSEDERKAKLRELTQLKYTEAVELAQQNGTRQQLEAIFRKAGLSGATVAKAVGFYLGMSEWLDLPISKYFKTGRSTGGGNGGRRATGKKKPKPTEQGETPPMQTPAASAASAASMEEQKKSAYIDLLMELAKEDADGGARMDLLNRLERAIGIPAEEGRP